MIDAATVIKELGLEPLEPEGGSFAEIYRSQLRVGDGRRCGSSIYYLLRRSERSCWHRVASDEIWYYHAGAPALQLIIHPDRRLERVVIGPDLTGGERPQSVIPAGAWQTAILHPAASGGWGLFGAAVFPGFEYRDFTGAADGEIKKLYPEHAGEIAATFSAQKKSEGD